MHSFLLLAQLGSVFAFLLYGAGCFCSQRMVVEFERYRLGRLRGLIGALQIAGALGLAAGFVSDTLRILSASCFAVMMFFALLVRARIGDPLPLWIPAFGLFALNLLLALL